MSDKSRQPVKKVVRPFVTGSPTDERTLGGALGFFGVTLMVALMTFLVCSMFTMKNTVLRTALNMLVEVLVLFVFYNSAVGKGADAVARGEILWQRQEKGQSFSAGEKAVCFHPLKGYLTALMGSIPVLICAVLLAIVTTRQTTNAGTIPAWLDTYRSRGEIGGALVAYTQSAGMGVLDILRIAVRIMIMPFVSMVGAENRDGMLLLEHLSPILVLLPALAYGTGYLQGRQERTKIHTGIAESNRRRVRREKKARKARMTPKPRTPEQLN